MFTEMKDTRKLVNCAKFICLNENRWCLEEEKRLVKTSHCNKYREKLAAFAKKNRYWITNVNGKPSFYVDEDGGYGYYAYFKFEPITKRLYKEILNNSDYEIQYWGYGRRMIV